MTLREIIYVCIDNLKGHSDDFDYSEEYFSFLIDKYRQFILKQKYTDIKKEIPSSNFQEIYVDVELTDIINGEPCLGKILKSKVPIPGRMNIGNISITPADFNQSVMFSYVSKERFKFVGENKYLQNIIYCTVDSDNYLYLKSSNIQFEYLEKVKINAIFEDFEKAAELSLDFNNGICDTFDIEYPLEGALVPYVIEYVMKDMNANIYRPSDINNNSTDNLENNSGLINNNNKGKTSNNSSIND